MEAFNIFDPLTSIQGKFFLEASAGTGKTFTIEHIILRALLEDTLSHPDKVLAVTFTNAATNELKQRIHATLRSCLETLSHFDITHKDLPPYLSSQADVKLLYMKIRNAMATVDQMSIFTIHGFCNFVLQQYFPGVQLRPQHPALTHTQVISRHIQDYLSQDLWKQVMSTEQFRLLTIRYNVTSKHTISLIEKLLSSYGEESPSLLPSLQHVQETLNLWHRQLSSHLQNFPKENFYSQLLQCAKGFKKQPFSIDEDLSVFVDLLYSPLPSPKLFSFTKLAQTFQEKHRLMRYRPCAALDLLQNASWQKHTEAFCNVDLIFNTLLYDIQNYLKRHYTPWISPDESIVVLEKLLSSPEAQRIVSSLRERYQLVLIDEFQDTDKKQWNIFSLLFAHENFSGSLFLIGDPKQSIYEWRNADLPTYLKAKSSFPKHSQLYLLNNYRSTPKLMHAINHLFQKISPFLEISGYPPIEYSPLIPKALHEFSSSHAPIHFFPYEDRVSQALWISSEALHLQKHHQIPLGNMAILVSDSSQAFDFITHCSLPVSFSKKKSVLHLTETYLLTLAMLEALLFPENYERISRVLLSSLFGLSASQISQEKERFTTYFLSLRSHLFQHGLLATFYFLCSTQGETLLSTPQGDLIFQEMEKLCSYLDSLSSHPYQQLLHLQFFSETGRWEEELALSLHAQDPNTLKITTIHSSKGLEYDVVFCIGLDTHKKNKSPSESLREMYVACTRAKKQLYIPLSLQKQHSSALSHYLQAVGSYATLEELVTHLIQEQPELFSYSSEAPSFSPLNFDFLPPETFSLSLPSPKKIYSFSSVKLLDSQDPPESLHSSITLSKTHLPLGKKTGLLMHKILEEALLMPHSDLSRIRSIIYPLVQNTHLEGYEPMIEQLLTTVFSFPLTFSSQTFTLEEISKNHMFKEVSFLFSQEEELWQGVIDLFFKHQDHYYIIDWKTSFLGENTSDYTPERLRAYIQKEKLDLQGYIYIDAAQKFLRQFDIHHNVEMGFVFLRGLDTLGNGFFPLEARFSTPTIIQKYPVYH
ncbi:exodeoxyribonuclease V subunit beta [Chlamydia pecorum]|nr:exodeoxyribonuclease V subunit beta [Chlamydia pecorum]AGW38441.1 exodeoxyribonuclease V, subunit beta [Chlamydia pecorum W73]AGW39366.1 exodeoxyribonuclease V, subunit beta [Chlamydia pecorum P787]ETF38666.1 exodeoxyribonuclease V subunit beta [Chlamydia pecorum VR629]UFP06879.1 exodeoxyribonuclease V subunit beta [Chlamydia pecorum]UJT76689.1 exodeoxyribonuclease V, beta subunit [Chlamydia pecorum]